MAECLAERLRVLVWIVHVVGLDVSDYVVVAVQAADDVDHVAVGHHLPADQNSKSLLYVDYSTVWCNTHGDFLFMTSPFLAHSLSAMSYTWTFSI